MASASPICLMARATSTKSCLWHQRLSHLNFDTINDLAKNVSSLVFQNLNIIKNIFVPHLNKEKAKRHLTHPNLFQILSRDGDMCMYALTMSTMEPSNVKEAMKDHAWIESMQEELLQFKRLDVWVLVPAPDNIKPLTFKWLLKNKHEEENTVIRNKTRLVMRGYRQEEGIDFE
ncbi:retrovirus-related pol polyprotein from transposon TNT 1-94 [Tanacetum coccineum]